MRGHVRIGLDGVNVISPADEGPGQLTGATADFEDAASGMQPRSAGYRLQKPRRVTRTGAVVLGCCGTEHHSASAGDQGAPIHDRLSVCRWWGLTPPAPRSTAITGVGTTARAARGMPGRGRTVKAPED